MHCFLFSRWVRRHFDFSNDSLFASVTVCCLGHLLQVRVLTPSRLLACLDIYPNIDRIQKITCPCFVMHEMLDQEVDVSHGQDLYTAIPDEYKRNPWWVTNRGHNDITDGPGKLAEYIRRLQSFLESQ